MQTLVIVLFAMCPVAQAADQKFDAFWQKFKTALLAKDKKAVASMTKFPFLFDSKQLNKDAFIANYDKIFPKNIANCLRKDKPVKDRDSYSFFCGETIYVLGKQNGDYRFTDIGVND